VNSGLSQRRSTVTKGEETHQREKAQVDSKTAQARQRRKAKKQEPTGKAVTKNLGGLKALADRGKKRILSKTKRKISREGSRTPKKGKGVKY